MKNFSKTLEEMIAIHNAAVIRNLNLYVSTDDTMTAAYEDGGYTYYCEVDEEMAQTIDSIKYGGVAGCGQIPDACATFIKVNGAKVLTSNFNREIAKLANSGKLR